MFSKVIEANGDVVFTVPAGPQPAQQPELLELARAIEAAPKLAEAPFALRHQVVERKGSQGGLF
jgi:hypothetical protein